MAITKHNLRRSNIDRINHLPGELIVNILQCLPLPAAVRTSIWSRRWRYQWVVIPNLIFDETFSIELAIRTQPGLLHAIKKVLSRHRGPVVKFLLDIEELKSCSEIDQFLLFVWRKEVKELVLHFWEVEEPYKLPATTFSCTQLQDMSLRYCRIELPLGFMGFNRLRRLKISKFSMGGGVLSHLISSCPVLEELTAENPNAVPGRIEVSARNLKYLLFNGQFPSITLTNTPRLEKCLFWLDPHLNPEEEASDVFRSLWCLSAVEVLDLDYYYVGYKSKNGARSEIATTFHRLRTLRLRRICFNRLNEMTNVLSIIRSSPNLETMEIQAFAAESCDETREVMGFLKEQDNQNFRLSHLLKVELYDITGTRPEMAFIKLLLAISPKLEIVVAKLDGVEVPDHGLKILKEVRTFQRLSPSARFLCKSVDDL